MSVCDDVWSLNNCFKIGKTKSEKENFNKNV